MKTFKDGVEIPLLQLVIQCCLALTKEEFQKEIERSKLKTSLELRLMIRTIISSHC